MAPTVEKLNIALVGCGRIADLHAAGLLDNPRARIHAVCDTRADTLARRKAQWGVEKCYRDYAELLADPAVDAVEILTPQKLHEPMLAAAAAAGKPVAMQKPISTDLASTDRMLAAVAASGIRFKVTENYVFYPPIVLARKLIADGAIGAPVTLRIQYVSGPTGGWEVPASAWEWRVKEASEGRGFATFDHGHHLWSTAWYLLGDVERVWGAVDSWDGVVDCPAVFAFKYASGKTYGSVSFVHCQNLRVPSSYYSNDEWIEVHGTRGILSIRRCTGNINDGPALVVFDGTKHTPHDVASDWKLGFVGATNNFVAMLRGEEEPLLSGAQARGILRFALALQEAHRTRRHVYPEELDRSFPRLYAWRRQRRELVESGVSPGLLERLGIGQNLSALAPQAVELTRQMVQGFTPPADPIPDTRIGLTLTGDLAEVRLGLIVENNAARLLEGDVPPDATLTVTMSHATWAAILLKRKRVETALLQGKIRFQGRAEEALKLKAAFRM